jgi:predicted transcriptional regulator
MPRPKSVQPTPAELEILKILWDRGALTVRDVLDVFRDRDSPRVYTTVMSLMNVMADKGLLRREPVGRAFRYAAALPRDRTLGGLVGDLWQRAFEGSASTLVTHLLEAADPTAEELAEIRRTLDAYVDQNDRSREVVERDRQGRNQTAREPGRNEPSDRHHVGRQP